MWTPAKNWCPRFSYRVAMARKFLKRLMPRSTTAAALAGFCVKFRRSSTLLVPTEPSLAGILALGTDPPDLACPQGTPISPRAIRAIHSNSRGTLARASRTGTPHAHRINKRDEVDRVTGLPHRDQHIKGSTPPVHQDVDFGGASPAADPQPLVYEHSLFPA